MTPRLHLPGPHATGDSLVLDGQQAHYLLQVLRLRAGESVQIFDGEGHRFDGVLQPTEAREDARHGARKQVVIRIEAMAPATPESPVRITLLQAVSAADKMDWTIEKATELGVAAIVPVASIRSQVKLDAARSARRHDHWQRLIIAASMQSGRDRLTALQPLTPFDRIPAAIEDIPHRWMLSPPGRAPQARRLSERLRALQAESMAAPLCVALLVGPESGLADDEMVAARDWGFEDIQLGPRVLRTETAGLAVLSAIQAVLGDL